jgi:hypothetical protein
MKTFKKTYLPDQIEINGTILKMYAAASALANMNARYRAEELKAQGLTVCIVEVLSNKLKGKPDLYGNPYKPSIFIFADLYTPEQIEAWRDKVNFWKKQFAPRTNKWMKETRAKNNRAKVAELWTGNEAAQNQAIKELLN